MAGGGIDWGGFVSRGWKLGWGRAKPGGGIIGSCMEGGRVVGIPGMPAKPGRPTGIVGKTGIAGVCPVK